MNRNHEHRLINIRTVNNDENMTIEGYAIIFDQPVTYICGDRKFTEVIKNGALNNTNIKDVPLKYSSNDKVMIMARTRNKSLLLLCNKKGLLIRANLIDTQSNRDLYKSIQEGLIDKMLFAFTVKENGDKWTITSDEILREINDIDNLWDISVVDTPFYDSTFIYTRSLELLDSEKRRLDSLNEIQLLKQKIILRGKI